MSPPTDSPILIVEHLSRTYAGGERLLTVLDDVSLRVERGSSCAVVGPSGSGKTTLLGLCAGLDRPSAGHVTLDGVRLDRLDEDGRARLRRDRVGFVFQGFRLVPTLTALENVMVPAELAGRRDARDAAARRLASVGLAERTSHHPDQLSGGEQQRVALARAFVNDPAILFADEPTGNLDGESRHRVADLLFELNAHAGTTLVLVTHDLELAGRTGRVVQLRDGRVASDEPVAAAPSHAGASAAPGPRR